MQDLEFPVQPKEIQNRRRQPVGWSELLTFAEDQIETNGLAPQTVTNISEALTYFPDDDLEANRYHSFSKIMCNMAIGLQQPDVRAGVIEGSSTALVNRHNSYVSTVKRLEGSADSQRGFPYRLNELAANVLDEGFKPLVVAARNNVDPATGVVADTLQAVSLLRRTSHTSINFEEFGFGDRPFILAGKRAERVLEGKAAAKAIVQDSVSGATATINGAYRAEHAVPRSVNPAVTSEELRELDTKKVLAQFASVHRIVFARHASNDGSRNGIIQTETGDLPVDPDILQKTPDISNYGLARVRPIHTKPLKCPALQVTDLIPSVAGTIPDMLESAEIKSGFRQ